MKPEGPGYYPKFSTLDQRQYWDAATRETVLKRVHRTPEIHFFSANEAELLRAVCDHVIPQDDRAEDRRIPILPGIDERLHANRTPGYRYDEMPNDPDAYRLALKAMDLMANEIHQRGFLDIGKREREEILRSLHRGEPLGAREIWAKMSPKNFWSMLVGDCIQVYYSHPWAWDEIGFGGPAYPRAYIRLENGDPEPWEVNEERYEWTAPEWALSDTYEKPGGESSSPHGQEGTH